MLTPLSHLRARRHECGSYTIMTALMLAVLLGFVGLAIDSSRQQSVHVELQNAADACALAAAMEMNGMLDATTRATLAGQYVGGVRNSKQFQNEPATILSTDVTFSDKIAGPFITATSSTAATRYVRCTVRQTGFINVFMSVLGIGKSDLEASAIASLQASRNTCSAPLAVCGDRQQPATLGLSTTTVLYNKTVGDPGANKPGDLYQADFSTCTKAESSLDLLMKKNGVCNVTTKTDSCAVKKGEANAFLQAWNTRFGVIHADEVNRQDWIPDLTGYAYPPPQVTGTYRHEQLAFDPRADYQTSKAPGRVPFQSNFAGGYPSILTQAELVKLGAPNRRLIVFPVTDCTGTTEKKVIGWACGLMLNPANDKAGDKYEKWRVQFIGLANKLDSSNLTGLHCVTSGIPGGPDATGPLVPTLIQ